MTNDKYKGSLELNWINKDKSLLYEIDEEEGVGIKPKWVEKDDIRVSEPRILKLKEECGDPNNENMLIKGDNLLALRNLVEEFKNREENKKVKCIYIDPPYNIGSAFEHYDDNLERSEWLTLMRDRLKLLKTIMRQDGIICIQINDSQSHYLKLVMDEIFGNQNYFSSIYIQTVYPDKTLKQDRVFHDQIEQILIYRRSNLAEVNQEYNAYSFDKFCWYIKEKNKPLKSIELGGKRVDVFSNGMYEIEKGDSSKEGLKEIWASGTILDINSSGRFFRDNLIGRYDEDGYGVLYKVYDIGDDANDFRYFTGPQRKGATKGKYYQGVPLGKLDDTVDHKKKISIENFWNMAADFGNCRHEGGVELKSGKKPEKLIKRLLDYFSDENDVVLDSFLGSGTTCAVAHKMNRKWIGIELGNHAKTHSLRRLKRVVNGEDQTGISKDDYVNWQGGGGFRYYEVGESIIKDLDMNWDMTLEEMSRSVFMNFDFSFIKEETYKLESCEENFYLGKQKGGIAICLLTKGTKIIKRQELNKLIRDLTMKYGETKITIFTNMGVAVKVDELDEHLDVQKIPESILKKYKLV